MSEKGRREVYSPLESAGGTTTIAETVVSQIAGMAAGEVEGIYLGGSASRRASGLLDRAKSSSNNTRETGKSRGVSAKVGSTEAALDLKMGIEEAVDLPELTAKVREKVVNRIENLVGLAVTEVNLTITDITSPEEGGARQTQRKNWRNDGAVLRHGFSRENEENAPERVPDGPPGTREHGVTRVEPTSRKHTESKSGPVPEEEVRVEDVPVEKDETATLDAREGEVKKRQREPKRQRRTPERAVKVSAVYEARSSYGVGG